MMAMNNTLRRLFFILIHLPPIGGSNVVFDLACGRGLLLVLLVSPRNLAAHIIGYRSGLPEILRFSLLYLYKHRLLPICGRKFYLPVITYKTFESSKSLTTILPLKF
jgi:hypothetical protein